MHLQMRTKVIFAAAVVVLAACSSDGLINNPNEAGEAPIAFSVGKKNLTRAANNLEAVGHYNFGVWAYKKSTQATQNVMSNYLVGYSDGNGLGYDHAGASTWESAAGTLEDHKSPWFYENLGKSEYLNEDASKGYVKTDAAYMSANENQYLRYWDLAYSTTEFYAYAPYRATGVSFDAHSGKLTVEHAAQTAGYDNASLQEFIYAGAEAINSNLKDVILNFKHLGAQVNLQFYENVPGYRIQIIDVTTAGSGIQATPATKEGDTYTTSKYYTDCGATIDYNANSAISNPKATVNHEGATTTQDNLKFKIPASGNGLSSFTAPVTGTVYSVIPEKVENTTEQTYATSPTVYYPVAQPTDSKTGFTFHVSYKLVAQDNGEEIIVNDARVYVPAKDGDLFVAAWQPNTKYTYTFMITRNSTGSTDPTYPDLDSPTVPATSNLYPIVFDGATVEDYTEY